MRCKYILMSVLLGLLKLSLFAQGWPVFDAMAEKWNVMKYLNMIDSFYQGYDMIQNDIQALENQYKQMQKAVETAQNIDWSEVQFDGSFDIRSTLKDAGTKINKFMTQIDKLRNSLTTPNIQIGKDKYSLADLGYCGKDPKKNLEAAFSSAEDYIKKDLGGSFSKKLTQKEMENLANKYGVSARNFKLMQLTGGYIEKKVDDAFVISTTAIQKMREERVTLNQAIMDAYDAKLDSDGNKSMGGFFDASLLLTQNLTESIDDLHGTLGHLIELYTGRGVHKDMIDTYKKQEEAKKKLEHELYMQSLHETITNGWDRQTVLISDTSKISTFNVWINMFMSIMSAKWLKVLLIVIIICEGLAMTYASHNGGGSRIVGRMIPIIFGTFIIGSGCAIATIFGSAIQAILK